MSWKPDALFSKAKSYMDRALDEDKNGPMFPFWSSLALEFLARSTLAYINPVLLAEPTKEMENILYALDIQTKSKSAPKSIATNMVFSICQIIIPTFTEEEAKVCLALANKRNEELHSGGLPFVDWPTSQWLLSFYRSCNALLGFQKKNLEDFLGADEAAAGKAMMEAAKQEVLSKVKKSINAHKQVFEEKPSATQDKLAKKSEELAEKAAMTGNGHRVKCPSCESVGVVKGEEAGSQPPKLEGDMIVVRTTMLPINFECMACGLTLGSHAELHAAALGGLYTHTERYDPMDYYGGYEPGGEDLEPEMEYDNE